MNNYTFFITEADTRLTTQQSLGDRKMWLLARESVYWINMNADIRVCDQAMCHVLGSTSECSPKKRHYIM